MRSQIQTLPTSAAGSPSPDALGVVRNLPGGVAGAALHPPVVPPSAVPDPQDDPEHGGIGRGGELAPTRVAAGLGVEWVGANTVGLRRVPTLDATDAPCLPIPGSDFVPWDRKGGVGGLNLAVFGVVESLVGSLLSSVKHVQSPFLRTGHGVASARQPAVWRSHGPPHRLSAGCTNCTRRRGSGGSCPRHGRSRSGDRRSWSDPYIQACASGRSAPSRARVRGCAGTPDRGTGRAVRPAPSPSSSRRGCDTSSAPRPPGHRPRRDPHRRGSASGSCSPSPASRVGLVVLRAARNAVGAAVLGLRHQPTASRTAERVRVAPIAQAGRVRRVQLDPTECARDLVAASGANRALLGHLGRSLRRQTNISSRGGLMALSSSGGKNGDRSAPRRS